MAGALFAGKDNYFNADAMQIEFLASQPLESLEGLLDNSTLICGKYCIGWFQGA
jgi:hypothetical protein